MLLLAMWANPAGAQTTGTPPAFDITVTAEVVEADAPVTVEATDVVADADGRYSHGVVVTWNGTTQAILDDERFTHHVTNEAGDGDLVTAGRGCGAEWSEQDEEVIHPCTLDLRVHPVDPGESHEYPVAVYPQVGPLTLEAGTYVVDQVVSWWRPGAEETQQQFTVRLTYEVAEHRDLDVAVEAEVVEAGSSVSVSAADPTLNASGQWEHGVRVTWNGTGTVRLDDARFTHHLSTSDGDLVTAGRNCAPNDAGNGEVLHACTADLQLIDLAAGETHEYPVRIYPAFASLALGPGTYVVDETIGWEPVAGGTREEVTVRLTYTVTEGASAPTGVLTPEPAASGVSLATWSGGPVEALPAAKSYWVTVNGSYRSYTPGAPDFVNARFLALYPDGLPAGTILLVVR